MPKQRHIKGVFPAGRRKGGWGQQSSGLEPCLSCAVQLLAQHCCCQPPGWWHFVPCRWALQDGKTTNEEVLRAMVLDGAVDDDAVDSDVFDIVDK